MFKNNVLTFYNAIAEYYDKIFPLSNSLKNFVEGFLKNKAKFLDIGCATGELAISLAKNQKTEFVLATDIDNKMLKIASKKLDNQLKRKIKFKKIDMRNIYKYIPEFDLVSCFGNTLVHLTKNEIDKFLSRSIDALKKDAIFLFQILNYDKILKDKPQKLPDIEGEDFLFQRFYSYKSELIEFKTFLNLKNNKKVFENKVNLYPITSIEIASILKNKNIQNYSFYGSFEKENYENDKSLLLICEIKK